MENLQRKPQEGEKKEFEEVTVKFGKGLVDKAASRRFNYSS